MSFVSTNHGQLAWKPVWHLAYIITGPGYPPPIIKFDID